MKISCRRSNNTRRSKRLFIMVSTFDSDSFPVRVRCLQMGLTQASNTSSEVSALEERGNPQRRRQGKVNSIDVVPKSLNIA